MSHAKSSRTFAEKKSPKQKDVEKKDEEKGPKRTNNLKGVEKSGMDGRTEKKEATEACVCVCVPWIDLLIANNHVIPHDTNGCSSL